MRTPEERINMTARAAITMNHGCRRGSRRNPSPFPKKEERRSCPPDDPPEEVLLDRRPPIGSVLRMSDGDDGPLPSLLKADTATSYVAAGERPFNVNE